MPNWLGFKKIIFLANAVASTSMGASTTDTTQKIGNNKITSRKNTFPYVKRSLLFASFKYHSCKFSESWNIYLPNYQNLFLIEIITYPIIKNNK